MVATRKKKRAAARPKHRASWRGQLRFGLVAFEVQAVNAEIKENAEVHFHLLHAPDHQRIHFAKVCPKHGEVANDEIIEGYEYTKGKYVEFDKEELDELRTQSERALTLDAFVSADEIDPIYFDGRMYYLVPSGSSSNEPYALLETAMERRHKCGIGQVVFSGREQLALVRPLDGVLTMSMLNYDAEIRKPSEIKRDVARPEINSRKLRLAEQLIASWHEGKFDFSDYKDRYWQKVKQAIEAKKKGVPISSPEEVGPEVINLMEALKRSVEHAGSRSRDHKGARNHHKKSSARKRA